MNSDAVLANFSAGSRFSRKTWALLSMEIWQRRFHDQAPAFQRMLAQKQIETADNWRPLRSVAARMLWNHYLSTR